jgi:hypothetical protein
MVQGHNQEGNYRALGPGFTQYGVPNALANPILELHNSTELIASNDNWRNTIIGGSSRAIKVRYP